MKGWEKAARGVGVLVLALAIAGVAVAQTALPRVVQAGDGTLYVIKDGSRFQIVGDPISDDELAGYTDGGQLGAGFVLAALATAPQDAGQQPLLAPSGPQFSAVRGASPGSMAMVSVQAAPGASCSIRYVTPAGTDSAAQGLTSKLASQSGVVSWTFEIGPATRRGTGTISVTCDGVTIRSPITIG